jgi:hypothetical protein
MELPIPDFGDVVVLRRLYRAAVDRTCHADIPNADKRALTAELARLYVAAEVVSTGSSMTPDRRLSSFDHQLTRVDAP